MASDGSKDQYRYVLGKEFERIPGPERHYREIKTGKVVSRSYVYKRARRVRVSEVEKERREKRRRETIHDRRVRWYANRYNHAVWKRDGDPWEYISLEEAESQDEFNLYEELIHDPDYDIRAIGYEYFRELEEEYDQEEWGETP
jgi:hypothetical protein